MAASTSYRLDPDLKQRLAERAKAEGVTETALVTRLLDEGLRMAAHPGVVFRGGATGRRAAVAGGPDVWEVVVGVRHATGRGDARIGEAAEAIDLPERLVRIAVNYATEHSDEIDARIALNDAAGERAHTLAEQRERVLAS